MNRDDISSWSSQVFNSTTALLPRPTVRQHNSKALPASAPTGRPATERRSSNMQRQQQAGPRVRCS